MDYPCPYCGKHVPIAYTERAEDEDRPGYRHSVAINLQSHQCTWEAAVLAGTTEAQPESEPQRRSIFSRDATA
jgi:hypothetical protein